MDESHPTSNSNSAIADRRLACAETCLVFLLFFLFAGWPAPDVNEAHYLAKAKHYWNPSWCAGDQFLESKDAHLVFNWTFGWLTMWLPLSGVAWVGRVLTWGLLAWSWRRLSFLLIPRKLMSVLTAGLMLFFVQRCHLAGEWIVGGVEAKGLSFVCVFLALDALVRDRWPAAWLLLGIATCFHVLVGGWSMIAAAFVWLASGASRPAIRQMWPAMVGAVLLALPGLIIGLSLTWGVDAVTVREANRIYVYDRLSHHLAPHTFPSLYAIMLPASMFGEDGVIPLPSLFILRHGALLLAWLALWFAVRGDARQRRLQQFTGGAVLIAAIGAVIDLVSLFQPEVGAALLRYYFFRLSDAMVAVGVALGIVAVVSRLERSRPVLAHWCYVVLILVAGTNLWVTVSAGFNDLRPAAVRQSAPILDGDAIDARWKYIDWLRTCRWVTENTKSDSRFLTPHFQQTFKWHAERSEVVTWKDMPQDAEALVKWWKSYQEVYPPSVRVFYGLAGHSDYRLAELARKYEADYIIIDRTRNRRRLDLSRFRAVYPNLHGAVTSYVVYRVLPQRRSAQTD